MMAFQTRLSTDVLNSIFEIAHQEDNDLLMEIPTAPIERILSTVSRQFRAIVNRLPVLWTRIDLMESSKGSLHLARIYLERSAPIPIDITYRSSDEDVFDPEAFREFLVLNLNRSRSIHILGHGNNSLFWESVILAMQDVAAPILRELRISADPDWSFNEFEETFTIFANGAPHLNYMAQFGWSGSSISVPTSKPFTLHLHEQPGAYGSHRFYTPIPSQMVYLSTLIIHGNSNFRDGNNTLELPSLLTLEITSIPFRDMLNAIRRFRAPALNAVTFRPCDSAMGSTSMFDIFNPSDANFGWQVDQCFPSVRSFTFSSDCWVSNAFWRGIAIVLSNLEEIICDASNLIGLINWSDPEDIHAYYAINPTLFYHLETIAIFNSDTGKKSLDIGNWLRQRSELGAPISTVKWPVKWPPPKYFLDAIRKYSKLVIWDAEEDLWSRQCRDCTDLTDSFKLS